MASFGPADLFVVYDKTHVVKLAQFVLMISQEES
jgi:hypothetical protein